LVKKKRYGKKTLLIALEEDNVAFLKMATHAFKNTDRNLRKKIGESWAVPVKKREGKSCEGRFLGNKEANEDSENLRNPSATKKFKSTGKRK
jgi:hypothetical protein